MAMFRREADRIIDAAHSAIASAEMRLQHSFTAQDIAAAHEALNAAQDWLRRAIAARDAWDSAPLPHDDYESYPAVPEFLNPQGVLI